MRLIDTHCHLNDSKAFPDPAATIREAQDAGVEKLVVIGTDEDSSRSAISLADRFDCVFAVVGWHPTSAAHYRSDCLKAIDEMLKHPKVVAVGEIGFDFYWDKSTPEEQERCLTDHMDLARDKGKPVVFHCRDAYDELLTYLEDRPPLKYLFHCFAGDGTHAKRAVALDAYFGFDGPITYPKNEALREIARSVSRDRILVETDSPYMSPVPHRGKPNRPAWVSLVNDGLAAALDLSSEACAEMTTQNAEKFYEFGSDR